MLRWTFHEPNLIRIKADWPKLFRPAELIIQMSILIPAELNSKGVKYSFVQNAYKMRCK